MAEVDDFLAAILPPLHDAEVAIHNGDAGPRHELWSHEDPVTLFGAALMGNGWAEVSRVFDSLATRFSNCQSCEWEVVAAGASGDLGYIVAIEHSTCSMGGAPPQSYELRSTTIYRRGNGVWKSVHRHADPMPQSDSARDVVAGLADPGAPAPADD